MIEWGNFALLRPMWLLALPAVALPFWLGRPSGWLAGWSAAVDPPLLQAMKRFGRVLPGRPPGRWLPATIAALLVLALAGPARRSAEAPTFRNLDGVMVLIDLSRSVALGGALPTALAAGRLVAEASGGRPVALVVYAGDAYLASPFSTDAQAVGTTIAALDGETVPDPGSCLRCALALTRTMLSQADMVASDIVLVRAGTGDAEAEVAALAGASARLSTLYVAPREVVSDMPAPDPAALADLARRAGGWSGDAAQPAEVVAELSGRPGAAVRNDVRLLTFLDLGRYVLVLPLALALGLFRRST